MKMIFVMIALLVHVSSVYGKTMQLESEGKQVSFVAVGKPAMLKIKGEGKDLVVQLDEDQGVLNGSIQFNLQTMSTGIGLRDEHLKNKYLEVQKFPQAKLEFKNFVLPKPLANLKDQDFKAPLSLHGITKEVNGKYDLEIKGNQIIVHAAYTLKVSDYGISIPTYMGITMADAVNVEASFQVKK